MMKAKRLLSAGLVLVVALVFAGCHKEEDARLAAEAAARRAAAAPPNPVTGGSSSGGNTTGTTAPPPPPQVAPSSQINPLSSTGNSNLDKAIVIEPVKAENLKKGDTVKFGPFEYTLTDVYVMKSPPGFPAGYSFVLTELEFKNGSPDLVLINTTEHFRFFDPAGKSYKANQQAMVQRSPQFSGNIKGGATHKGWLGFLLKTQTGKHTLQITLPELGYANFVFEL